MSLRQLPPRLGVVFGFVLVALVFTWPLPLHLGTHLTGDPGGDTGVYVWNQWVFSHEALVERRNPLTTSQILSLSQRVDLSQHNYTAFLNLLALPLQPMFGVITSFNLVFLLATVLTALCGYGLARHAMDASRLEAWIGGVLFAWSPVLVARSTGHFSLVAAAPLAAFIWALAAADRSRSTRHAALAGLCVAWAAFCDAYYAVFCLLIAVLYLATHVVRINRRDAVSHVPWRWFLDLVILSMAGLVLGLLLGRGAHFNVFGLPVTVRGLYTPVLVLSTLVLARVVLMFRFHSRGPSLGQLRPLLRPVVVGVLACAGPLAPVIYGFGVGMRDGQFIEPKVFWRSSPSGADLLAFVRPNPNHPLVKWLFGDAQQASASMFVEFTAALSLVAIALVIFAVWRAGFRPKAGWWWLTAGFAALALGPFIHIAGSNTYVPGSWALLRYVPIVGAARSPTRFAIVAALGLAMLAAGALAAIGQRWPARRGAVGAVAAALVLFELFPAPRTLYSARISPIYSVIAADPRPVRVLGLPFGVRDGVSSVGNFSARQQFRQTVHGKRLIGGYISRVSPRRVEAMRREFPVLGALIRLSEKQVLSPEREAALLAQAPAFARNADVGYVVIEEDLVAPPVVALVIRAFGLTEISRDGSTVLYRPQP